MCDRHFLNPECVLCVAIVYSYTSALFLPLVSLRHCGINTRVAVKSCLYTLYLYTSTVVLCIGFLSPTVVYEFYSNIGDFGIFTRPSPTTAK